MFWASENDTDPQAEKTWYHHVNEQPQPKMKILLCVEREEPCRSSKLDLIGISAWPFKFGFCPDSSRIALLLKQFLYGGLGSHCLATYRAA